LNYNEIWNKLNYHNAFHRKDWGSLCSGQKEIRNDG
jgi:hypothetical protein